MLIYQKFVIRNITPLFLVSILLVIVMLLVTKSLRLIYLVDRGMGFSDFCSTIVLIVPSMLFMVLPFALLFVTIFTYSRLMHDKQLVALKALGVSNFTLAKPAIILALFFTIISYYNSIFLMPYSYRQLKTNLYYAKNSYSVSTITPKTFYKLSKDIMVYVKNSLPDGNLEEVIIFDNRQLGKEAIIFAKSALLYKHDTDYPVVQLNDGMRQAYDGYGNLTKLHFNSTILTINDNTKQRPSNSRDISEYYLPELLQPDSSLPLEKKIYLRSEGHQRIIWPLYNLSLIFLGLAILLSQTYSRKFTAKPFILTIIFLIIPIALHFSIQSFATKNLYFILLSYINIISSLAIGGYLYFTSK